MAGVAVLFTLFFGILILFFFALWVYCLIKCLTLPATVADGANKILWLLVIFFLPFLGCLLFLLVGPRAPKVQVVTVASAAETPGTTPPTTAVIASPGGSAWAVAGVLLLVLVPIGVVGIGIVGAIAIPQFSEYRNRGFESILRSDVRNLAVAEEAYFVDNERYASCRNSECAEVLPGISGLAKDATYQVSGDSTGYEIVASHSKIKKKLYWRSGQGFVE